MNKQNKIIVGIVALVLALTVGYAIFSQSLNINGTAKASANFGLIFEESTKDPTCKGYSGGEKCKMADVAEILEDGRTLKISIDKLLYPTAYVKIPVLVKNVGTVDAVLESIQITEPETSDIVVKYSIIENDTKYSMVDGKVENGTIIKPGDDNRKEIEVEISWNKDSETSEPIEVNFNMTMNYKQVTNAVVTTTSSSDSEKCTEFTKKDTYKEGELISFCNTNTNKSEDFYVIKDNGNTVTALAKYNLMVGNKFDYDGENEPTPVAIPSSEEDYGLQSKKTMLVIGESVAPGTYYGFIAFANKDENNKATDGTYLGYWTDTTNYALNKPLEAYGTSYPADVYKEEENKTLLREPLRNYEAYFTSTLNKTTAKMRLITYNELVGLGCDATKYTCKTDTVTTNKREWIYKTNYWSASAHDYNYVWYVYAYGYFVGGRFWYDDFLGVRPVITISKSDI